ncbi:MAG TPA: hypothetical protein VGJ32_07990 [Solirubrobacteraceae bacterium]
MRLRAPAPVGRPLVLDGDELRDGETVVARASLVAPLELQPPSAVGVADAERARERFPWREDSPFPGCFACGTERPDGLRCQAGPVDGRDGLWATPWLPDARDPALAFAALDCPSACAAVPYGSPPHVLAALTAHVHRAPEPGAPHVVVSWALGVEGRRRLAASALLTAAGEPIAVARATWAALGRSTDVRVASPLSGG